MSLRFGAATSDRVECPSTGTSPTIGTLYLWSYISTLTAGRKFWSKAGTLTGFWEFGSGNAVAHRLQFGIDYNTTDITATSNDHVLKAGCWQFIAATFNATASLPRLYVGTEFSAPTQVTYATQTAGSGTRTTDSGAVCVIGNRASGGGAANAIQGDIALCHFIEGAVFSSDEIQNHWEFPRLHPYSKLFMLPGDNGVGTQIDQSGLGNHGTVTGATVGPNPFPVGPLARRRWLTELVAAGARQILVGRRASLAGPGGLAA